MTTIKIAQLYPRDMNLYGDWGNVLVIKKRLEWCGLSVEIIDHNPGDKTDFSDIDMFIGGGGQDSGQTAIQSDLLERANELRQLANDGVPMLMICGMYQLFGRFFRTLKGEEIIGANILPIETIASRERMIGNIVIKSQDFGEIVGYENHSGQTFLDKTAVPLGQVIKGAGNNMRDAHEGVQYHNIIATYLHGPILPKNPRIADFLINEALKRRGLDFKQVKKIDDTFVRQAREIALKLPR